MKVPVRIRERRRLRAWVLMLAGLLAAGPAPAVVRYVDVNVAGGATNGTSWANAYTSVATALAAAVGGDQLWVARGTYTAAAPLQLKGAVTMYGGFTNDMPSLAARDWNLYPTLLNGAGVRQVVVCSNNTVLDGFVITNGYVSGGVGGGMLIAGTTMTVRNCLFVNNVAAGGSGYGGALAQTGAGSVTTISNCVFRNNSAVAGYGGAIYWAAGSTTLRNCTFAGNTAAGGGAVYALALAGAIEDSVFVGNRATSLGGGAVFSHSRANCVAAFRRCVFADNAAFGGSGFGGAFSGWDTYTIESGIFSANRCDTWAGAMFGADNATRIRRSIFAGNEAPNGGGAAYYQGGLVNVPGYLNCLFAGNFTAGGGGALYLYSNSRFDLTHNTFANNHANGQGGALYALGGSPAFGVTNCVFWTNTAGGAGQQIYENQAATLRVDASDVQGGWGGLGTNNQALDPQFTGGPGGAWLSVGPFHAGAGQTALTATNAVWAVNAHRGLVVNPHMAQALAFVIASNSTDTLYVWGNALTNRAGAAVAQAGGNFAIRQYLPGILSPVVDAGANLGVADDLPGAVRPQNEGYDQGAYEVTVPTVTYTLATSPSGLGVLADANTEPAPRVLVWKTNSVHQIGVASPQAGGAGTQYVYSAWSDGGAQAHSVTALVHGATLTAAFTTQLLWSVAVEPVGSAGNVTPVGGVWYDLGAGFTATATAGSGWVFAGWSGGVTGTNAVTGVTMSQARHAVAQFSATGTLVRTHTAPLGRDIVVDGTTLTTNLYSWQPGEQHTLAVAATQTVGAVRYVFLHWENGSTATQRLFTTGAFATNLVAHFKTQYALTWTVTPGPAFGHVEPASPAYVDAGTLLGLTAVADGDVPFGRWTGAASGTATGTTVLMDAPKQVAAHFYHGQAGRVIYVNDNATGANSGLNWFDARVDFAQALAQAVSGDAIWVAQGTYTGGGTFPMKAGVNVYGGFGGWEGATTARDWTSYGTFLDGQGARRVILATNNAVLDGFIITNGASTDVGAGLLVNGVAAEIRNCTFANNVAAGGNSYGGALAMTGAGSFLSVSNCVFRDNAGLWGGALHTAAGTVAIRNSVFARNTATTGGGGVMYVTAFTGLVEDCVFVGNRASTYGGGVAYSSSRFTCNATFRRCVFADNAATGQGGAFVNADTYTFEDSLFSGNRTPMYGGVTAGLDGGTFYRRCLFGANESGHTLYGGAAVFQQNNAALSTFENVVLAGNVSAGPGGALEAFTISGFSVRHGTFSGNRAATSGGAVACGNGSNVQLVNSVLWGDSAGGSGAEISEAVPGSASVLYSAVQGGWSGTGNSGADPKFEGGPAGSWTGAAVFDAVRGQTALSDTNNSWAPGFLAGRFLNPNTNQFLQFVIASNSAHTIYVWGNAATNRAGQPVAVVGAAYRVAHYQSTADSLTLDAGVDFGVTEDIRQVARPQPVGGTNDMGAYEGAITHTVAFTAASTLVGEPVGTTSLPVALDNLLYNATGTVEVAVTGGSATPGVDYQFTPQTLIFDAAHGAFLVPVTILTNGAAEGPRTIVFTLQNAAGVALGALTTHTITILDDDGAVSVAFDAAASGALERVSPALLGVSLSQPHGVPVSVQVALTGGSATPGMDFVFSPQTLTFAVGETNRAVPVTILDNAPPEEPETVTFALHTPVGASLGAITTHTFTILDDDRIYVDINATGANNGTSWTDAYTNLAVALGHTDNGDSVWVARGTYRPAPPGGNATNRFEIHAGAQIYGGFLSGMGSDTLRNPYRYPTILSGDLNGDDVPSFGNRADNVHKVVYVSNANGLELDGFTIRGGQNSVAGIPGDGAGLQVLSASPFVVSRCTFTDNQNNGASAVGAGMAVGLGATGTVRQCLFYGNTSTFRGGGFAIDGFIPPYAKVDLVNCTVTDNAAATEGDGVYARADTLSVLSIKNSIIWNNNPNKANPADIQNIRERGNTTVSISYSDYNRAQSSGDGIQDFGGQLTTDPLFADPVAGDFHLQSQYGRTVLPSGSIVFDPVTSPCVDAGDPLDPCDEEPQTDPCRVDMGAYGGTSQSSGSLLGTPTALMIIVR